LVLAAATACTAGFDDGDPSSGGRDASSPDAKRTNAAVAVAAAALTSSSSQGKTSNYFFGYENGSLNIETASALIPPNVNSACPSGRAFITMGRWIQWMDLDCLSNPNGIAGCHLDGAKSGQIDTDAWVAAQIPQTLPTFYHAGTGTCIGNTQERAYVQGGSDSAITRTGASGENLLVMFAGARRMARPTTIGICGQPKMRCAPETANAVNFTMRSTNCGTNWTVHKVIDNGDGIGNASASAPRPAGGTSPRWCGNLDMFLLHRNPYSPGTGSKYIYAVGGTGSSCCGGVGGHAVYRSSDDGQSFQYKTTIDVGNPGNPTNRQASPFAATVWPDGTVGLFGCDATTARTYWSWGSDDAVWKVFDGATLPCRMLPADQMPAKLKTIPQTFAAMSRVTDSAPNSLYNYARIAFPTLEFNGSGVLRTSLVLGHLALPRNGAPVTPSVSTPVIMAGASPENSFFRASFASDSYFPAGPDTAVLYWQEGDSQGRYFTRYSTASGLGNYTPARDLSVSSSGALRTWTPNFNFGVDGLRWGGEFDRPSFYQVAGESGILNDVYHAFTQWTESHASEANSGYVHYNTVNLFRPRFSAFTQVSTGMALMNGTGPAAVTVAANSPVGEKHIHVYAVDASNRVRRIRYTNSTATWSAWIDTHGVSLHDVAATSWGTGRVDVFAVGQNNMMWHMAQNSVNEPCCQWESLSGPGGGFIAQPGAASQRPNQLFVAGVGIGGNIWYRTYKGSWSSWKQLAGGVASSGGVAAVSWGPGRIDVFVRGQNGHLWHYSANDDGTSTWEGKGGWEDLGGAPRRTPGATSDASGRLHVFARDANDQVQHLWYDSGWSDWHTIGGSTGADLGATSTASTRVAVFARGENGLLWWSRRGF
jgi:hypothetical protein